MSYAMCYLLLCCHVLTFNASVDVFFLCWGPGGGGRVGSVGSSPVLSAWSSSPRISASGWFHFMPLYCWCIYIVCFLTVCSIQVVILCPMLVLPSPSLSGLQWGGVIVPS